MALAEILAADRATGVPDTPMEPAVDVRFTVPVAVTFKPPGKLDALLMLPEELRVMAVVAAAVPTAPCNASDPFVDVSSIVVPRTVIPLPEFKLPEAVRLKSLPAAELLVKVVVPALESLT